MFRITLAIFVGLLASAAQAEEILLKSIWAANMPDARNIRELEPRTEGDNREFGPLMYTIYRTMQGGRSGKSWGRPDAGPGFPVPGTGIAALNAVYDILVDNDERPEKVRAGEVSIVFFARQSGADCHLEKVEREGKVITITYRFHARQTANVTGHLALIPLGVVDPGEYDVRLVQLPVARPANDPVKFAPPITGDRLKRTVSQPFSFEVQ